MDGGCEVGSESFRALSWPVLLLRALAPYFSHLALLFQDPNQAEPSQYVTPPRARLSGQPPLEEESPSHQGLTRSTITQHFGKSITPISSNSIYRKRPQGPGLGLGSGRKDEGDWAAAHTDSAKKPEENKGLLSSIIGW
jgi:hypothetical protein